MSVLKSKFLYRNKEWLYDQYIVLNKNATEIGREFKLSISGIRNYIKKFGFVKSKEDRWVAQQRQMKKTLLENYGVDSPLKSKEIMDKKDKTCLERFGSITAMTDQKVANKRERTLLERYGVDSPLKDKDIRLKYEETCLKKYNHKIPTKNKEIIKKIRNTVLKEYGVDWISKSSDIKERVRDSLIEAGHIKVIDGSSISKASHKYNVNYTALLKWNDDNPNGEIEDFLKEYSSSESSLEKRASDLLNIKFYNKKFDKNLYPDLKYRPDFKLSDKIALNVDGLYWHSELVISSNRYHFNMRREYEDLGLRIFQFRADEVLNKGEIIKSMINHNTNNTRKRIFARKCKVVVLNQDDANKFYSATHIMGTKKAKHLGLLYKGEIVMMMSFSSRRFVIKIERLSSKLGVIVVGGFSKLLSYMESNNKFSRIDYWVDLRYGTGRFLLSQNFKHEKDTLGWKWTDFKRTYNRLRCRANMDERGLSQKEHAEELGWHKIYDAGQRLYSKI